MRYNNCYTLKDKEGEVTIKRVFLFKPLFFCGDSKTRFFEFADVMYRVTRVKVCNPDHPWCWKKVPIRFATESDLSSIDVEESVLSSINTPTTWSVLEFLTLPIAFLAGFPVAFLWFALVVFLGYKIRSKQRSKV